MILIENLQLDRPSLWGKFLILHSQTALHKTPSVLRMNAAKVI